MNVMTDSKYQSDEEPALSTSYIFYETTGFRKMM